MALLSSTTPWRGQAFTQVISQAAGTRAQAENALATLQAGPVDTVWVFNFLDQLRDALDRFTRFKNVTGLDAFAVAERPDHPTVMTVDIAAVQSALQNCIDWVISNFPKDTTGNWPLAFQWGANGRRVPRSFPSSSTTGLQPLLQILIAAVAPPV